MEWLKRSWLGRDSSIDSSQSRGAEFVSSWRDDDILFNTLEGAAFGAALLALDGRMLKANPFLCEVLGYSLEEILDLGIQGITHPGDPHDLTYFNQILSGSIEHHRAEKRYLHRLGHTVWAISNIFLVKDSNHQPHYFLLHFQEITKYKRDEHRLLQSQTLLQGVVDGTPDVVFVKDCQGRYVIINAAGARLIGRPIKEILGKDDTELYALEDAKRIMETDRQVIKSGESNAYEVAITLDGGTRAFLFTKTPYRNQMGETQGLVGIGRDVTEHQQAAEHLENSRAELRALSAQLQSVREEERMRISREIHDELGQVLTGLKMDVVSLARRMSDATATRDWRQLKERAQSIAELINNAILTVRRISTELRPGLLDAVGLTAAIEWQAKEFENRTGIKCRLELPGADIVLDQNRSSAVFRIFQEILTNITRHAQASEVNVILEASESNLFLEARDNGRGIRASEFSNPKSLGLLGMRERALLLGGEFNIRGVQGKGTTVTVRIPLESKPATDEMKTSLSPS
ncbi:MAG: PAS domain S-box protein [Acidobacteriota bacterium]